MTKYIGIKLEKNTDCGIASVTCTDTTTSTITIDDDRVDLYASELEYFVYWINCTNEDHTYNITVSTTNPISKNPSSTDYLINIIDVFTQTSIESKAEAIINLWHTTWSSVVYEIEVINNIITSALQRNYFSGNGSNKLFALGGNNHSLKPYAFSRDGGSTWMYSNSYQLTWGSNSPNYNDEIVDSNGYFGVVFDTAPDVGDNNIIIEWVPLVNTCKVVTTLKQPNDGSTFIDNKQNVRLLDHVVELI